MQLTSRRAQAHRRAAGQPEGAARRAGGPKLADLTEQQALILTDERRAAREAAHKEARESSKDRQATADALDAALKMSDAEKTQLAGIEQRLRELSQEIRDHVICVLTAEKKAELEKKFGVGRWRN